MPRAKTEKKLPVTEELRTLLREKYCSSKRGSKFMPYAMLTEVRSHTGFTNDQERYCDALVMSLWKSGGRELIGFEIKASRNDWLKEVEHPEKSEPFFRVCDRWFLLASSADFVREGELPPTWGLMVPHGKQLRVVKEAPKLEPEPISREFLASLFRSAHKEQDIDPQLKRMRDEGWEDGYKSGVEHGKRLGGTAGETLVAFEKASGLKLSSPWQAGNVAGAVKLVMAGKAVEVERSLKYYKTGLEGVLEKINEALAKKEETTDGASGSAAGE